MHFVAEWWKKIRVAHTNTTPEQISWSRSWAKDKAGLASVILKEPPATPLYSSAARTTCTIIPCTLFSSDPPPLPSMSLSQSLNSCQQHIKTRLLHDVWSIRVNVSTIWGIGGGPNWCWPHVLGGAVVAELVRQLPQPYSLPVQVQPPIPHLSSFVLISIYSTKKTCVAKNPTHSPSTVLCSRILSWITIPCTQLTVPVWTMNRSPSSLRIP